jgi:hypothetical protein
LLQAQNSLLQAQDSLYLLLQCDQLPLFKGEPPVGMKSTFSK